MLNRDLIYKKFNGCCFYTGKPLGSDWQIDHIQPKCDTLLYMPIPSGFKGMSEKEKKKLISEYANRDENLVPSLRKVNHYKRHLSLEKFRAYIAGLQSRIDKLPKWVDDYEKPTIVGIDYPVGYFSDVKYANLGSEFWRERRKYLRYKKAIYIKEIAMLFGITKSTPFSGKFYFEQEQKK